jgi:hypothetical protein
MLTDLTALRSLTLLNHSDDGFYFPPTVDLELFKKATNLRRLAVATFTPDVERLLGFPSLAKSLAEFTVFSPFRKPESGNIEPYLNSPNFAWERISLYCWPRDFTEMTREISKLPLITELKLDIDEEQFESFKTANIPELPNLETLLFLFQQFQSSKPGDPMLIDFDYDEAEYMLQAKDIFRRNRQLVSRNHKHHPLRYVGFCTYIYTCTLFPSNEIPRRAENVFSIERRRSNGAYATDLYRVTRLSVSEAITFYDVRQALFHPDLGNQTVID